MTLQELGSLGEFVAAIGLIFSLMFVGLEIRKTRKQSTVEGAEKRLDLFNDFNRLLLTHPELREAWLHGQANLSDLNSEERYMFYQLMTLRFTIFTRMFVRATELKDRDSLDALSGALKDQFSDQPTSPSPGQVGSSAIIWWRQSRGGWRMPFREFVDEILHDHERNSA